MSCPYGREDLSAYVDAEVDETTASGVREHLRTCAECRREVASLKMLTQMIGALPRIEPDAAVTWNAERLAPASSPALHCPVVLPEASAMIDGELPEEEAQAVVGHLAACDPCHRAYKDLERISEAMARTEPVRVPAGLEARIMAAIEAEGRFSLRRWLLGACESCAPAARVSLRLAAAAAFVLVVTLGVLHLVAPAGVSLETVTAPTATVAVIPSSAAEPAADVTAGVPRETAPGAGEPAPSVPAGGALRPFLTGATEGPATAGATETRRPAGSSAPTVVRPPGGPTTAPEAPAPERAPAPHRDLAPMGTMMTSLPPSHPAPPTDLGAPGTSRPPTVPAKATPPPGAAPLPGPPPVRVAEGPPAGENDGSLHVRVARSGSSAPVAAPSRGIRPESLRAAEARLNETVRSVARSQPKGFTINP